MKKVTGIFDDRSTKKLFEDWGMPKLDEIEGLVRGAIREAMEIAVTEYECQAYFPIEWQFLDGSDGIEDGVTLKSPTTIYVELPLGSEDDNPRWKFELADLVKSLIADEGEGAVGEDARGGITAVRDDLRYLAGILDELLARKDEPK